MQLVKSHVPMTFWRTMSNEHINSNRYQTPKLWALCAALHIESPITKLWLPASIQYHCNRKCSIPRTSINSDTLYFYFTILLKCKLLLLQVCAYLQINTISQEFLNIMSILFD